MADSVLVLNDYSTGSLSKRTRASGKSRYTVEIKSEPLLTETDPRVLGRGPAEAMAKHLRDRVEGISTQAAPATIKARQVAARAVAKGEQWATKRYSGGRLGLMQPHQSDRLFNDSGRLVRSIVVGAKEDSWIINVAANRLHPDTLNGGEAALLRIFQRLRELVPEWGDARALGDVLSVRRAIRDGLDEALQKAEERGAALKIQRMKTIANAALQVLRAVG